MRDVLFRGKPINKAFGDKFIYGSLGVIREDLVAIYDCLEFTEDIRHFVIPETVGQYTGLTDKNGTKIFEGDIVQSIELELKGIIVFDEHCRFMIKEFPTGATYLISYNNDEIQVIGNIHDNPEVLGGVAK